MTTAEFTQQKLTTDHHVMSPVSRTFTLTSETSDTRPKALVIGAGFGGLASAIRLSARGYQVEIIEKLDAPGGKRNRKIVVEPNLACDILHAQPNRPAVNLATNKPASAAVNLQ